MPTLPKDPTIRQRKNRSSSRALLPAEDKPRQRAPVLDKHPSGEEWHRMTRRFWRDLWSSPVRFEILRVDEYALFFLTVLMDQFFKKPSIRLAAEIRMHRQAFGLTPLDRRRLEWSVAQAEEAKDRHEEKRSRRAVIVDSVDPRILEG